MKSAPDICLRARAGMPAGGAGVGASIRQQAPDLSRSCSPSLLVTSGAIGATVAPTGRQAARPPNETQRLRQHETLLPLPSLAQEVLGVETFQACDIPRRGAGAEQ